MKYEIPWKLVPVAIIMALVLDLLYLWGLYAIWPTLPQHIVPSKPIPNFVEEYGTLPAVPILLFLAALEEVIFRLLPLFLFIEGAKRCWMVWTAAVASSIIFGWLHVNWFSVFVQGVGGMLYCTLFLYAGGWNKNYGKAMITVVTAHALFNLIIQLRVFSQGG